MQATQESAVARSVIGGDAWKALNLIRRYRALKETA